MGFKDLRSFIAKLEEEKQLVRYTDLVQPSPDIGRISRVISNMGNNGPAVLFDNIAGYQGKKAVVGIHASWANHALSFDLPKDTGIKEQFFAVNELWDKYPGEVTFVDNAPCQEVVIDENINLYEILPLYRINHLDGGCYIGKASVVTSEPYDPDNLNATNVGTYRLQVQAEDTLGLQLGPFHDGGEHYAQAEKEGIPLPVCICLGNDPLLSFMASTPIAYDQSEYLFASAMGGFTYELTHSLNDKLPIPANCEYVLEGEILPHIREMEGPFGEFPGTYSGTRHQLLVKIKKITHRIDPIFESLYIGFPWTEADTLMAINTSVPLYKQLRVEYPQVAAVNAMYQHGSTVIVATEQRMVGQAKSIAMRLASTPHGQIYARNIIMVDAQVDPFDLTQVMWALSTRARGDDDINIVRGVPGIPILPCVPSKGTDRKLIIDATTSLPPDDMRDNKVVWADPESDNWGKIIGRMQAEL